MDVFEAMETCRAMRYLRPDPVPEKLIRKVLHAATRASNPGNSQAWEFLVVRDAATRRRVRDAVADTMLPAIASVRTGDDPVETRMLRGAAHLVSHLDEVPVLVFVCGRCVYPPQAPTEQMLWAALYPAAQNLIVAARALGLGTTFTTFHMAGEAAVRDLLRIPSDVRVGATIALGWPARPFGPVHRRPLAPLLHWDTWQPKLGDGPTS